VELATQDVGVDVVAELAGLEPARSADLEGAAALLIEEGAEQRGRIEAGETEPLDRAGRSHQGEHAAVTDDAVIEHGLRGHGSFVAPAIA
jgi:hypothetical protein